MKIKPGFKIRKMCGSSIVISVGKNDLDFNGMITLNDTGELLWTKLTQGAELDELVQLLVDEYGIDAATAQQDVAAFVDTVKGAGFLE